MRDRFKGLDLIAECLMNYGQKFVTLYRRQGSRPSPRERNSKRQNGIWGGLTNSCEKKRREKQRRKGKSVVYVSSFHPRYLFFPFLLISKSWDFNCVFRLIYIDHWWKDKDTCCVSAFSRFLLYYKNKPLFKVCIPHSSMDNLVTKYPKRMCLDKRSADAPKSQFSEMNL